jgi:prolyl oligopeptidase
LDFSKDGSKVAYAISEGGSDWRKVIIMDAITNTNIEDTIVDVKFSGVSWKETKGFTIPVMTNQRKRIIGKTDQHKLYFHKLGGKTIK